MAGHCFPHAHRLHSRWAKTVYFPLPALENKLLSPILKFDLGAIAQGAWGLVGSRGKAPVWGSSSRRSWSSFQRLFTYCDCTNDQNLKILKFCTIYLMIF